MALDFWEKNSSVRKLYTQIFRFGITGFLALFVDLGIFLFCERILNFHFLLAGAISFSIATILNWYLSSKWVFSQSKHKNKNKEILIFYLLAIGGLLLNEFLLWTSITIVELSSVYAKIIAGVGVAIWSFVTRKIFLYR